MSWYSEFGSVFWISVGGIVTAISVAGCKLCYKCKISEMGICFGLVSIKRDTSGETDIDRRMSVMEGGGGSGGGSSDNDTIPANSSKQNTIFQSFTQKTSSPSHNN